MLAHAAQASRKDVRDAVVAARKAFPGWAAATPYNRGQVLYRIAEMLEGRREQFAAEVADAEGVGGGCRRRGVEAAIDRWVWYAGWADKFAQVAGSRQPGRRPVLQLLAARADRRRRRPGAAGLEPARLVVSVLAPVLSTGNTAVVVASERRPLPAVSLAEVLATSDVPGGVVNVLTGRHGRARSVARRAPRRQRDRPHRRAPPAERAELQRAAADNVKRVFVPPRTRTGRAEPGLERLTAFVETKTVWHPIGV